MIKIIDTRLLSVKFVLNILIKISQIKSKKNLLKSLE